LGPFVWNSNQNIPQLPPYSLYIKSGFSTTNYDSFGFDVRLWAKELLDYFHVPTWDASCQGPFAPCAWVGLPSCGTTPLDIYNIGGGGVQIRTQNCKWFFSDGCDLYLPGAIIFPDGTSLMSAPRALSITDGSTTVTGVTAINFTGASVSGTSPNGVVTITSASLPSLLPTISGGTGISTYTLGDTLYGNNSNSLSKLAGNTSTTQKFLTQTGTGSVSAIPSWFDLFNTANTWSARQTFSANNPTLFTYTNASLGSYGTAITHLNSYVSFGQIGNGAQWILTDSLSGKTVSTVRLGWQSNAGGSNTGYVSFGVVNEYYTGSTVNPYFTIDGGKGMNASFVPLQVLAGGSTSTGLPSTNPAASLDVVGSFATNITAVTSSTSLGDSHSTILCSAATGAITITLPVISGRVRRIYTIKKIDSSGNSVTITPNSGDTVEGSSSYSISTLNAAITIQCYGSNWYIIGKV
jgi:hypothetical protein